MSLATVTLDAETRAELDAQPVGQVMSQHRDYRIVTEYAQGQGYWKPGQGDPGIRPEPAAAQAIGYCVANRTRYGGMFDGLSIHPSPCGWCDYPMSELLIALDWAVWISRYVTTEYAVWFTKNGRYNRSTGRSGEYLNPEWQAFWHGSTPSTKPLLESEMVGIRELRRELIAAATGR